jgi:hypothetical protein
VLLSAVCLVVLPLCQLVSGNDALAKASLVSVVFLGGFTSGTLALAAHTLLSADKTSLRSASDSLALWRLRGVALCLPILTFAFTGHAVLFPCVARMREPTVGRVMRLVRRSLACATAVYVSLGLGGYVLFGEDTAGNVLRNLHSSRPPAAAIALKLVLFCSVCAATPVTLRPLSELVLLLLGGSGTASSSLHLFAAHAAVLSLALSLSLLLPNMELVFALAGSTAAVMYAYILPAAAFLAQPLPPSASASCDDPDDGSLQHKELPLAPTSADLWLRQEEVDSQTALAANAAMAADLGSQLFGSANRRTVRRLAWLLLASSAAALILCTLAVFRAVSTDAAVVRLAQTLVREDAASAGTLLDKNGSSYVATAAASERASLFAVAANLAVAIEKGASALPTLVAAAV